MDRTFWQTRSLKARLIVSTSLLGILLIPVVAITLNSAFERQLKISIENELNAYSYAILAVAETEDDTLFMPEQLLENQFNVIQSGLYALITQSLSVNDKNQLHAENYQLLWHSPSWLSMPLPARFSKPKVGQSIMKAISIEDTPHIVFSFSVSFSSGDKEFPITLHIIKEQSDYLLLEQEFKQKVWSWLGILISVFLIIQLVWLYFTLKPLSRLTAELESIELGKSQVLKGRYPDEIEPVIKQVNTLLKTEQQQRQRYRNALSDLAHRLKTPLSVIQSQPALDEVTKEQLTVVDNMIEHQLKRAQSAGDSAWHLGVNINETVNKLMSALEKIYCQRKLSFQLDIDDAAIFKGDEADLMEILGNLLDNACKAAKQQIAIEVKIIGKLLRVSVEDDGMGIDDDEKEVILQRGVRADTYDKGHGIGLAIVRDLVASYHGQLIVSRSERYHGAKFVITFRQN
ncbi:ATP-binding protein [Thalassotalea sp. PLHSN55]|uniref:ATP-binding protein n=1 Tax=Thalassotalea sp. PLHSN55 TaxID=3435888 RepID=UPI003F867E4D